MNLILKRRLAVFAVVLEGSIDSSVSFVVLKLYKNYVNNVMKKKWTQNIDFKTLSQDLL